MESSVVLKSSSSVPKEEKPVKSGKKLDGIMFIVKEGGVAYSSILQTAPQA